LRRLGELGGPCTAFSGYTCPSLWRVASNGGPWGKGSFGPMGRFATL
jgi:hypothetical protein